MINSKDLCLITVLAAVGFVSAASINQVGYLLTGIPGVNAVFTVVLAILTGFSLLVYEGRRWRFFLQITVFTLLITPLNYGAPAFDFLGKTHLIIAAFFTDLVANTVYELFKKQNKRQYWAVLNGGLIFWSADVLASVMLTSRLYIQYSEIVFVLFLMSPVIIIEAIFGSYLGYKIFGRISKAKS